MFFFSFKTKKLNADFKNLIRLLSVKNVFLFFILKFISFLIKHLRNIKLNVYTKKMLHNSKSVFDENFGAKLVPFEISLLRLF